MKAELYNVEGRTDGRTDRKTHKQTVRQINRRADMTKLIIAFNNFANAPNGNDRM